MPKTIPAIWVDFSDLSLKVWPVKVEHRKQTKNIFKPDLLSHCKFRFQFSCPKALLLSAFLPHQYRKTGQMKLKG